MEKLVSIPQLLARSRRLPVLVIVVTLLILAGTIFVARQQLRTRIRQQIIGRDATVLHAVAQMHFDEALAADGGALDVGQQLTVVLKTSRLSGVMGARLFDPEGKFVEAFDPADVLEADLAPADLPALKKLQPVSHFYPAMPLSENFWQASRSDPDPAIPLLEVNVPLHAQKSKRLTAIAQFLIEGESIAAEFHRLDRNLTLESLAAFAGGGVILVATLGWAFRRLRHAHDLLTARTQQLLRANQELALAAKTSALGAVSAHLIHGLKNPLSGLQSFMANRGTAGSAQSEDWEQAVASTRRMQAMINEVVNVLREEQSGVSYELTVAELAELIAGRVQPLARQTGATFIVCRDADVSLPNRVASLVAFILVNLIENSLQATPPGKTVSLRITETGADLVCEVKDEGPGLPEEVNDSLFVPGRSTKGSSGIGLAISKQLANHLGAGLELKSSTAAGCVFVLTIPMTVCSQRDPMEVAERR